MGVSAHPPPPGCRPAWRQTCLPREADTHPRRQNSPLWTEWHTGVKTLPCPRLRLRVVKIFKIPTWGRSFPYVRWWLARRNSGRASQTGSSHSDQTGFSHQRALWAIGCRQERSSVTQSILDQYLRHTRSTIGFLKGRFFTIILNRFYRPPKEWRR